MPNIRRRIQDVSDVTEENMRLGGELIGNQKKSRKFTKPKLSAEAEKQRLIDNILKKQDKK